MRAALVRLSRRTGWTEGDAWTVALGLSLATALAVSTIPSVWEHRGSKVGAQRSTSATQTPAPVAVPRPQPPFAAPGPPPLLPPPAVQVPYVAVPGRVPTPAPPRRPIPVVLRGLFSTFAVLPADGSPGGLAVGEDGSVLAGTDNPGRRGGPASLLGWDQAGRPRLTATVPGQPADRLRGLTALDRSPDGGVVAADAATGRVLRHRAGRWSVLASLPDLPVCLGPLLKPCQPGFTDTAPLPLGLAVDANGDVFVSDAGQGTIWHLRRGAGSPEPWYQNADILGTQGLAGLALEPSGSLLAVVTRLSGLQATGAGALLRFTRTPAGAAGARSTVASFAAGEGAADVALGASRLYVVLHGADAVIELDRDGTETLRFTDDRLEAPTAIAVSDGRLLVATAGNHAAVLQVGVD